MVERRWTGEAGTVDGRFLRVEISIAHVDVRMYSAGVWGREREHARKAFGRELIFAFCS